MKVFATLIGEEYCHGLQPATLEIRGKVSEADRREIAQAFAELIDRVYDRCAVILFEDECPACESRLREDGACTNTNCTRNLP